jgi:hypothetical protein
MRTALATAGPGAPSAGASTLVSPTLSPPGPPMTLGNMRSLGVRSLFITCSATTRRCYRLSVGAMPCSCENSARAWSAPGAASSAPTPDLTG